MIIIIWNAHETMSGECNLWILIWKWNGMKDLGRKWGRRRRCIPMPIELLNWFSKVRPPKICKTQFNNSKPKCSSRQLKVSVGLLRFGYQPDKSCNIWVDGIGTVLIVFKIWNLFNAHIDPPSKLRSINTWRANMPTGCFVYIFSQFQFYTLENNTQNCSFDCHLMSSLWINWYYNFCFSEKWLEACCSHRLNEFSKNSIYIEHPQVSPPFSSP